MIQYSEWHLWKVWVKDNGGDVGRGVDEAGYYPADYIGPTWTCAATMVVNEKADIQ